MRHWPAHDYKALREEQLALAPRVDTTDRLPATIRNVAGFDAAYDGKRGFGALVTVQPDDLDDADVTTAMADVDFPYVPGFLAYREMPMFAAVWKSARVRPDVVIVDGSGILHPTRFGQACHFGVRFDVATIGVSKKLFVGEVQGDVTTMAPGDVIPVLHQDEHAGWAVRGSARSKHPIYVSPGHRVSVDRALDAVRSVLDGLHRLPVPQQLAHEAAGMAKRVTIERTT